MRYAILIGLVCGALLSAMAAADSRVAICTTAVRCSHPALFK